MASRPPHSGELSLAIPQCVCAGSKRAHHAVHWPLILGLSVSRCLADAYWK